MADALRGSMDAAEYKHVVRGLIFLKYISDAFEEAHTKLLAEVAEGADPEDPDEYRAQNIFWLPLEARWPRPQSQARQPTIGRAVDDAMAAIERDNPALKDDPPAPSSGVYFVYAISCEGGSIYIGHTDNIPRRWKEHLTGKAADWTRKNRPRYIPHYEEFKSRAEAVERERELKTSAGRRWLKRAIAEGRARQAGGEPFEEKMTRLTAQWREQQAEARRLDAEIEKNLKALGFGDNR